MRKITEYSIVQNKTTAPINITIWEHNGNRIQVTHHPKGGYFAFFNNDKEFGHSRADDPMGIVLWVLGKLGLI